MELEIFDAAGILVRKFSSSDPVEMVDPNTLPHPTYWIRPAQSLEVGAGHQRFVWDLRYTPPKDTRRQFSIAAVYKNTPSGPHGPFVQPGTYRVRLRADGQVFEQALEVLMDPRVESTPEDLQQQFRYSMACYEAYHELQDLYKSITDYKEKTRLSQKQLMTIDALLGGGPIGDQDILYGNIRKVAIEKQSIRGLQAHFLFMQNLFQAADMAPTLQSKNAVQRLQNQLLGLKERWEQMK
ncbi:MAG: hypothetical protein AAF705_03755 [Bacteroidota bacterium]